jgi:NAD(P)-dependent dehydrogenase (short-subunit alcohol dehydrogenase family)
VNPGLAVVTGASGGIGSAACRAFRAAGSMVVGLSRGASPDADRSITVDVTDRDAVAVFTEEGA